MSLRPNGFTEIPAETSRVARAAFPKGCLAMRARDVLGPLFTDEQFAVLFAARERPAWSPARLALVLVLQFVEGLTDRQAADAVRARLDWKYALGLDLCDPGFDASVLTEFRGRLLADGQTERLLTLLLDRLRERGLRHGGGVSAPTPPMSAWRCATCTGWSRSSRPSVPRCRLWRWWRRRGLPG
jgi:transposase